MRKQSTNGQKMLRTMERVTNSDDHSGAPEPERPRRGRLSGEADFLGRVASWNGWLPGAGAPKGGCLPGEAGSQARPTPKGDRPLGHYRVHKKCHFVRLLARNVSNFACFARFRARNTSLCTDYWHANPVSAEVRHLAQGARFPRELQTWRQQSRPLDDHG